MAPPTQEWKRGVASRLRLAFWCGVGGVALMFAMSVVGVLVGAYWPENWIRPRSVAAADAHSDARIWHVRLFSRPGWSDVMASRSPSDLSKFDMDSWKGPDWHVPGGAFSGRLRRGDPLPVVHADGEVWWREYATGWPWRAWRGGDSMMPAPGGHTVRSESTVTFRDPLGWGRFGYLVPYGPVWSGIVGNSLVGAVGIWALVVLPAAVRWARRRGRGLCVACGYDLAGVGGGVCPECGGGNESLRVEEAA
jgi:hypothetical protein